MEQTASRTCGFTTILTLVPILEYSTLCAFNKNLLTEEYRVATEAITFEYKRRRTEESLHTPEI